MIESIKKLLKDTNSETLKKIIKEKKTEIERDYDDNDKINEDFLFTMLSKGYIDEDYRYYIAKSYDDKFELDEKFYINNVKDELHPEFKLKIEQKELVVKEIRDYQWSSPSVLNFDILTYLISEILAEKNSEENSEKLNQFIIAIEKYYKKYEKNDFFDQYIDSIKGSFNYTNIIDEIITEISKKINLDSLNAFFSDKSGSLFCKLINKCSNDDIKNNGDEIKNFIYSRNKILIHTLSNAIQEEHLKNKLIQLNIEITKLTDYKDNNLILQFLINEALFCVSKENLDYIFLNQQKNPPYQYYDYIRNNKNIKKKIIETNKINEFIDTFILSNDKIQISPEGAVELILNIYADVNKIEQFIEKIDFKVNLSYIPKIFKDEISFLSDFTSPNIIQVLIKHNKIEENFNNALYVHHFGTSDISVNFINDKIDKILVENDKDDYAWSHYLPSFFQELLKNDKIDSNIILSISILLAHQNKDILDLIDFNIITTKEKELSLVTACFFRENFDSKTNRKLLELVKINFDDFLTHFFDIKWKAQSNWHKNILVILRNRTENVDELNILDNKQLESIINLISPYCFSEIIKNCFGRHYNDASLIIEKILNEKNLTTWLNYFGVEQILEICDKYKEIVNGQTTNNIKEICGYQVQRISTLAQIHGISGEVIADKDYTPHNPYCNDIISQLKTYIWDKQNSIVSNFKKQINSLISKTNDPVSVRTLRNDLFVVGRNLYQAANGSAYVIMDLIKSLNDNELCFKQNITFNNITNPILCGAAFEIYFDNNGYLRKSFKKKYYEIFCSVLNQLESDPAATSFINHCLKPYIGRYIYIPGNADIIFNIVGNVIDDVIEIQSITYLNIDILTNYCDENANEDNLCHLVKGSLNDLKKNLGNYFSIPLKHIVINTPNHNIHDYKISNGGKFIKPLYDITLAANFIENKENNAFDIPHIII